VRFPQGLLAIALLLGPACMHPDEGCAPAEFPQSCQGYTAEFTVNGEARTERGDLGALLIDNALPERRYYVIGTLISKLELTFPRAQVGRFESSSTAQVGIGYTNGDRYVSSRGCGDVVVEISGMSRSTLWGRFQGPVCGDALTGAPGVKLALDGRFTAKREDP
jgi:hypothetical protein